jgi:predicted AAA+ superfamily ATPase
MEKNKLKEVLQDQQGLFDKADDLIERDISLKDYMKGNEIVIITGIRRCGKSSLLKIISKKLNEKFVYMNFDDIRLTDFKVENFEDIEEIVSEIYGIKTNVIYLLDEIQNVPSWERWVNNLYAKKIKVFVIKFSSKFFLNSFHLGIAF